MKKRKTLLPKKCSRCGNFLMQGVSLFFLPYENRYICFCSICHKGLDLPDILFTKKDINPEFWEKFWEEEIK